MQTNQTTLHPSHHPAWLYVALALTIGPVLGSLAAAPWLADMTTYLVSQFTPRPDLPYEGLPVLPVRVLVHVAFPSFATFFLIRYSGLGRVFSIPILALVPLITLDALILFYAVAHVGEYAFGFPIDVRIAINKLASPTAPWLFGAGLGLIFCSTIWTRVLMNKPSWLARLQALLRPI